jgi:hypothetical protein
MNWNATSRGISKDPQLAFAARDKKEEFGHVVEAMDVCDARLANSISPPARQTVAR